MPGVARHVTNLVERLHLDVTELLEAVSDLVTRHLRQNQGGACNTRTHNVTRPLADKKTSAAERYVSRSR